MRNSTLFWTLLASLAAGSTACNQVECADGTIERDGVCVPGDLNTDEGKCGPFTVLQGDQCVPMFPPTECDPVTTVPETDPETGVTTCKGNGMGGCGVPLPCPAGSSSSKMTICGQIYDFKDHTEFAAADAKGVRCDPANPTTSGPCALMILAFDAIEFGSDPTTAPQRSVADVYIDDCGRYKLTDIDSTGTSPYIGLGFDDAGMQLGPAGVTLTVGVVAPENSQRYVKDFEAFIANASLVPGWQNSGYADFASNGAYAPIFRAHREGSGDQFENQAGVTVTKSGNPVPANDYYFRAADTDRTTLDSNATATGANGTALYTGAKVSDLTAYGGTGGLGAGCRWEPHAAASLPGILFVQVFRKIDIPTMTCND